MSKEMRVYEACKGCATLVELPPHNLNQEDALEYICDLECAYVPPGNISIPDCPCQICLIKSICHNSCEGFIRNHYNWIKICSQGLKYARKE